MNTQSIFEPGVDERYLDTDQLSERWKCHPKTVSQRARNLGVPILLLGGAVRFPLSQILRIEQLAVAQYGRRKTESPPQFAKAPARGGAQLTFEPRGEGETGEPIKTEGEAKMTTTENDKLDSRAAELTVPDSELSNVQPLPKAKLSPRRGPDAKTPATASGRRSAARQERGGSEVKISDTSRGVGPPGRKKAPSGAAIPLGA